MPKVRVKKGSGGTKKGVGRLRKPATPRKKKGTRYA